MDVHRRCGLILWIAQSQSARAADRQGRTSDPPVGAMAVFSLLVTVGRRSGVKRVLITGMSGTGKSSVIHQLAARGFDAVDLDCDEFSHWVEVLPATSEHPTPASG